VLRNVSGVKAKDAAVMLSIKCLHREVTILTRQTFKIISFSRLFCTRGTRKTVLEILWYSESITDDNLQE